MWRQLGAIVAGVVGWVAIVTVLNLGMRHFWPEYAAVEKTMAFTLPMMIARLSISGVSSLLSGAIAAVLGRERRNPALGAGLVLMLLFLPVHYALWHRFPIWYHLTFLISLVVLSLVGGYATPKRKFIFQSA